jgi:hypothetical protein
MVEADFTDNARVCAALDGCEAVIHASAVPDADNGAYLLTAPERGTAHACRAIYLDVVGSSDSASNSLYQINYEISSKVL